IVLCTILLLVSIKSFFFQAEDGIRDDLVTGVQTCALPILIFHRESGADVTVAARPVPLTEASQFGVLGVDRTGRVVEFQEKPERPKPLPDNADRALVSMGNYLFSRQALVEALVDDARRSTAHDFGRSIIPELVLEDRVFGYDFQTNDV